ncbi:hypothetical protein [Flavobacterium sp.]|uniref:hypothetical protein n=1 Tax=Flavobacterium sp. TaxID=239 RepID=UPI00286D3E09|nr:hypothetical protein [Flavobacterium sp.]
MKTKILFLGLVLSILSIGCSKDDNKDSSQAFSSDEAKVNSKIDVANDDVSDIVEGQYDATASNEAGRSSAGAVLINLPSCATVTRNPDFGITLTPGTEVTKTVDFGTEGCPMANGNVLKGKIIITFTYQPEATSHTINYQFDNFYHNAIKFTGNKTFTRTMSGGETSHPIVTMVMDMTATFPDSRVFTRVGTRTREIIAGMNTPNYFADNIYQVTGNWTTTFPNTTVQTSTITTPLLVKMSCVNQNKPLLVQGVITFLRNGNTATLDYGNGECDNLAVFTINGNSYNIILGGN